MKQRQVKINDLIMSVCQEMEKIGYRKYYVWGHHYVAMRKIEKHHELNGCKLYVPELTEELVTTINNRYDNGELSGCRRSVFVKAAKYLNEYYMTGHITRGRDTYTLKPTLCTEFQRLLDLL